MRRSVGLLLVLMVAACDGDVSAPENASGSGSGSGASGTGAGSGSGGEGNAGTGGAGVGGGVSTAAGGASSASGGASSCSGLFESECIATAHCAPVYDDICCPTCDPKNCADCSNFEFHHCDLRADICSQAPACGHVPDWVCGGSVHICPDIVGGDTYECESTPGCVVASCSPDVNCNDTKCATVSGDSCTAMCDAIPPSCPAGTTAEGNGSCYTGYCIPSAVCGTF